MQTSGTTLVQYKGGFPKTLEVTQGQISSQSSLAIDGFLSQLPYTQPPEPGGICGICPWVASRVETNEAQLEHPRGDFTPVVIRERSGGAAGPQRGSRGAGRDGREKEQPLNSL